jgi:N-acetylmuramoyl-L-alanine amidase
LLGRAVLAIAVLLAACAGADPEPSATEPEEGAVAWPSLVTTERPGAVVTPNGFVLPVVAQDGDSYTVTTPCDNEATLTGAAPLAGAHVVIDPGHGGRDPGALGPDGLREADVNLAVAQRTDAALTASGATVVLTRSSDVYLSLATRADLGVALDPLAFVSIHHNAEPDGPWPRPGSETYYQVANAESKRLAGLLWEELVAALEPLGASWVADTDAGAKYRLADGGGDYYGVLRGTHGITAVLSEAAFITNPTEATLLADPEVQQAEAQAIARAVARFVSTDDPGSGFTEPYPRPSTGTGGTPSCTDPPLG